MRRAGLLLAALALLAACGTAGAGAPAASPLVGEWELREGTVDGAPLPMPTTATLVVSPDRVTGRAFCNSYDAGYDSAGEAFSLADLSMTEAACLDAGAMAAEQTYVRALTTVSAARVGEDLLVLTGPDVELRFGRAEEVPDRELTGTRWVLDTLVDGQTASSTVAGTTAVLVLAADGTLTGSTGCRDLAGSWAADGDELRITGLPTDGCAGPAAAQDGAVLAVLAAGPVATVDEDRLRVTAPDGRGLGYRAG
ncbi:META domain-containing protein [Blastococcus sp. TF02A-26]|uniref:META domain-containing protein n=1 Tax=Blastococcus sp. TF02A-26 TaxID=2250577 RepID=UPI0011BE08B0|nr:META domain-containing protein [Blastococcus sp. TF02A-26]